MEAPELGRVTPVGDAPLQHPMPPVKLNGMLGWFLGGRSRAAEATSTSERQRGSGTA
jgi:hypothetical protein